MRLPTNISLVGAARVQLPTLSLLYNIDVHARGSRYSPPKTLALTNAQCFQFFFGQELLYLLLPISASSVEAQLSASKQLVKNGKNGDSPHQTAFEIVATSRIREVYHPVSFQDPRELVITFHVLLVSEGSWLGLFSWGVSLGPHLFAVCQKVTGRTR